MLLFKIFRILELIIPRQKHATFRKDLMNLLKDATNLWTELKKDSCMVRFDTDPPEKCTDGWLPETCLEVDPSCGFAVDNSFYSRPRSCSRCDEEVI
jgi:hypothetical protein